MVINRTPEVCFFVFLSFLYHHKRWWFFHGTCSWSVGVVTDDSIKNTTRFAKKIAIWMENAVVCNQVCMFCFFGRSVGRKNEMEFFSRHFGFIGFLDGTCFWFRMFTDDIFNIIAGSAVVGSMIFTRQPAGSKKLK